MNFDPARAKSLFLAAADLSDPLERAAYLDRECADQPELRARVEALLAANTADVRTLGDPAATGGFQSASGTEAEGVVIAERYKLRQQIGEGGMGTVWLADQTEPVKRRVAVKLIRVERGQSKTILARFEAERQAIALMDHPHIAKLLDAGTTATGAPFFVMELVKGVPLNEFCDQHKLTIPERLSLFTQICSAVQHAHQKGIIHRDLKPGNILVESHDGKPVPKVIDFGLAKATTGLQLSEQSMVTAFGNVMGTPLYMAPEQAMFNAVDVDTRADVYALGVILYELLTGTTPITRDTLKKAAFDEMLRLVREQEAPTPSSRLSSADSAPSVAASRQIEPAKLGRFVQGELDWIVMKALSKERDRRYETANGFARDIERFLNHEPVQAGPPTARYRLQKFVRRNRGQVVAASLVLLALIVGVVGTTLGLVEAKRQAAIARSETDEKEKARAEEARQRAAAEANEKLAEERLAQVETEKQIAKTVKDFLQKKLLAQADSVYQANTLLKSGELTADVKLNPTIRELLDRAAKELAPDKIATNFPNQPLVQAEILQTVGGAYLGVGAPATAIELLKRSSSLYRQHLGDDQLVTLLCLNQLAHAYRSAGRLDQALALYQENYHRAKSSLEANHRFTRVCVENMAGVSLEKGLVDEVLPLLEQSFETTKATLGPEHLDTITSMAHLAAAYLHAGQLDRAFRLFEKALAVRKSKLGPDHPNTIQVMHNLAGVYRDSGQVRKAIALFEEARTLGEAKHGPDHPNNLAVLANLANCYGILGQHEKALALHEETLKRFTRQLGPEHPDTLHSMHFLASGYARARQTEKGIALMEKTIELRKAILGPDHRSTLMSINALAMIYRDSGQPERARPMLEEVVEKSKATIGPEHLTTLTYIHNLAAIHWSLNQLDLSVPLFENVLTHREKKLGRTHPETLRVMANLGVNYRDAGRLADAVPLLEETYAASEEQPSLRWVNAELLDAYAKSGKGAEAKELLGEVLADARQSLPPESFPLAGRLASFGLALLSLQANDDAEPILRECLAIREKLQPKSWLTFNTQSMLGAALLGQKKYADAEPLLVKGYEGMKTCEKDIPAGGRIRIPEALDRLIAFYTATNKPDEVKKYRDLRAEYPTAKPETP